MKILTSLPFVIITVTLFLQSCSYKQLYDHTITDPIEKIDYLKLTPSVVYFDEHNQMYFSEVLEENRWMVIDSTLIDNERLRINKKIVVEYEYELNEIKDEIAELEKVLEKKNKLYKVAIPPVILETMRTNDCDYLAVPVINSFIRTIDDKEALVLKSIGLNLISIPLAGVVFLPKEFTDPYMIYYRFFVFDRKNNRVAYYRNYPKVQNSIMNDRKLKEMQIKMFRDMYISTTR